MIKFLYAFASTQKGHKLHVHCTGITKMNGNINIDSTIAGSMNARR
jgi:hypothetical protein